MSERIIFIDTETTGLDDRTHQVTELAWCGVIGPSDRLVVPHFTHEAEQAALDISGHHARELWDSSTWASREDLIGLHGIINGATLGGANIGFDLRFLSNIYHDRPWHHRPLDVEAYAAGALGWEVAHSLSETASYLRDMGFTVHESDHTAQHDVLCARDVYLAARLYSMEPPNRRIQRIFVAEQINRERTPE